MTKWKRWTACALLPVMLSCGLLCTSASAQVVQNQNPSPTASSSDDDKTNDYILIGMLVVVVSLLFILGIKSDRDWRRASTPAQYAAQMNGDGSVDRPLYRASPEEETFELTTSGFRARF